jgi:YVTN family beta-propeller protein
MQRSRIGLALLALATACTSPTSAGKATPGSSSSLASPSVVPSASAVPSASPTPATGVPPLLDPHDIYAAGRPGLLAPEARRARALVYVPNSDSGSVTVIDQRTRSVVDVVHTGRLPQHVTPSYDLKTLYVDNDMGNSLTPIDPRTGRFGTNIPVDDPYNLYFTPDGRFGIVVAERLQRLDFRDPDTMKLVHALHVDCKGVDHMDFSADGTHALVSCEFAAKMIWVDVQNQRVEKVIPLMPDSAPQDVKLSPDGKTYYVADMQHGGVHLIDAATLKVIRFLPTGRGAHGLYPSRDAKTLYITNRTGQSVSLLSFATRGLVGRWTIPGGTPDMGGLDASGNVLWLTGRYSAEVYAIDTRTGRLVARIAVGAGPHGLCVWPQPGRYSLGHTGILR